MPQSTTKLQTASAGVASPQQSSNAPADAVAEPRHRVGPRGVSSGVSFRELPEPCFQQLKKVCLHYTEKCSGKYENNKMAARYVHQLASEVLFLLSGISEEIQIHQDIAKLAEQRLREWNTNFPDSLKSIGNPQDIASLVSSQKLEIRALKEALQTEKANKQRDMSHAMKSMDCQLHASRNGALNERQKLGLEYETLKADMKQKLDDLHTKKDEDIRKLHEYYAGELKSKTDYYEGLLSERDDKRNELEKRHQAEKDSLSKEMDQLNLSLSKQRDSLRDQIRKLEDKLDNQTDANSVATDDLSLDDDNSITVTTSAPEFSTTDGCPRPAKKDRARKYKKRLSRLMKELNACHEDCSAKDAELRMLSTRLREALDETARCNHKLRALSETNDNFRYHMSFCSRQSCGPPLSLSGRNFERYEGEILRGNENVNALQHVPHFLYHSEQQEQMKSYV